MAQIKRAVPFCPCDIHFNMFTYRKCAPPSPIPAGPAETVELIAARYIAIYGGVRTRLWG
jgi:hypothetical protein